jgi:hypothetical protein
MIVIGCGRVLAQPILRLKSFQACHAVRWFVEVTTMLLSNSCNSRAMVRCKKREQY